MEHDRTDATTRLGTRLGVCFLYDLVYTVHRAAPSPPRYCVPKVAATSTLEQVARREAASRGDGAPTVDA